MTDEAFSEAFAALTGHPPFPWQTALYKLFAAGTIPPSCNLPTGLGKTSVIAVWLIALANHPDKLPRRLAYVVNRRTVVDQTTEEVENYRHLLGDAGPIWPPVLADLADRLAALSSDPKRNPLAVSTLRGQFADNRAWSADPSRPAVVCGTVDMIGSRLLFSGYGIGRGSRPLHAGFLGQDALLVHDEAHLEPAFQELLIAIEKEQARCKDFKPLKVMELTATTRGTVKPFGLTDDDRKNDTVKRRVGAPKALHFHDLRDEKKLADQLAELALGFKDKSRAVLVFARTVEDVLRIQDKLPKGRVVTLTGTMRGKERDGLVEHPIFQRFLPSNQSDAETTYLVCTSAGEVGVNISADHLVCDLSTFDSMAQRFGRVNRFGQRADTEVHVVRPTKFEKDTPLETARQATLKLLGQLDGDASPDALGKLDPTARQAAFAPPPTVLPATDILFDAWSLTTIKGKLPGRPHVEPYLHGVGGWEPPETHVAWREEVEVIRLEHDADDTEAEKRKKRAAFEKEAGDLVEAYPLKPHELLREPSYRAFKQIEVMAKRLEKKDVPVWLYDEDDESVQVLTLKELADKDKKDRIEGKTVLFPPSAGGLEAGMLNGGAVAPETGTLDVADDWFSDKEKTKRLRIRLWDNDEEYAKKTDGMHSVYEKEFKPGDEDEAGETWEWFAVMNEGEKTAKGPVLWEVHVKDVEDGTKGIVGKLPLDGLGDAIGLAEKFHDHGKKRKLFQTVLGNFKHPGVWLAKSGKKSGRVREVYRHEFGSLLEATQEQFSTELAVHRDLILHLIAAHHGRARPHFPRSADADEAFDPERPHADAEAAAAEVPRRFARLQRKYGRWGLAYLESLLRAADWAASANPSEYVTKEDQP